MSLYPKKCGRLVNVCNGSPCPQSLVATSLHLLLVFLWCLLCKVNKYLCQVWKLLYSLYITRDLSKSITWHYRLEMNYFCVVYLWKTVHIYRTYRPWCIRSTVSTDFWCGSSFVQLTLDVWNSQKTEKKRYLQISTIRYPELEKKPLKNEHIIVFLLLNLNMCHR